MKTLHSEEAFLYLCPWHLSESILGRFLHHSKSFAFFLNIVHRTDLIADCWLTLFFQVKLWGGPMLGIGLTFFFSIYLLTVWVLRISDPPSNSGNPRALSSTTWCHMMWCHAMWCHVIWCHAIWYHMIWCYAMRCSCDAMPCDVMWSEVIWSNPSSHL